MAKIVINLTCSTDNADKATVAMVVANAALVSGQQPIVFLSSEGVHLATRGCAETINEPWFAPMKELLSNYVGNGGVIWVCTPCFKKRGLTEASMVENAALVGGATLVEVLAQGTACISY